MAARGGLAAEAARADGAGDGMTCDAKRVLAVMSPAKLHRMLEEVERMTLRRQGTPKMLPVQPRPPPRGPPHYLRATHSARRRQNATASGTHKAKYIPDRMREIRAMDDDAYGEWKGACDRAAQDKAAEAAQRRAVSAANRASPPASPSGRAERHMHNHDVRVREQVRRYHESVESLRRAAKRHELASLHRLGALSETELHIRGLLTVLVQARAMVRLPQLLDVGRRRREREVALGLFYGNRWRHLASIRATHRRERAALGVLKRNFHRAIFNMRAAKKHLASELIIGLLRSVAKANRAGRAIHHYRHCIVVAQRWWREIVLKRVCWLAMLVRQFGKWERRGHSAQASPAQSRRASRARKSLKGESPLLVSRSGRTVSLREDSPSPEPAPRRGSLKCESPNTERPSRRTSLNGSIRGADAASAAADGFTPEPPLRKRRQSQARGESPPTEVLSVEHVRRRRASSRGRTLTFSELQKRMSVASLSEARSALLRKSHSRSVMTVSAEYSWDLPTCRELYPRATRMLLDPPVTYRNRDTALAVLLVRWIRDRSRENTRLYKLYADSVDAYLRQKRYIQRIANFTTGAQGRPDHFAPANRHAWQRQQRSQRERVRLFEEGVRLGMEQGFASANRLELPYRIYGSQLMDRREMAQIAQELTGMKWHGQVHAPAADRSPDAPPPPTAVPALEVRPVLAFDDFEEEQQPEHDGNLLTPVARSDRKRPSPVKKGRSRSQRRTASRKPRPDADASDVSDTPTEV